MKKLQFILACAALTALSSCSSDDQSFDPNEIRITTNVGGIEATTRAATNIHDVNNGFKSGDIVNVYIFENADPQSYLYGTDGDGLLQCTANESGDLILFPKQYYPASGNNIDVCGIYPIGIKINRSSQDFSVQIDQSTAADGTDDNYRKSDLMFATVSDHNKKDGAVKLSFHHKLSKVVVKLQSGDGVSDSDIANAKVEILKTITKGSIASVTQSVMGNISPSNDESDKQDITMGKWTSSADVAAIVIPQTIISSAESSTPLFKVTLSNGATYTYKPTENVKFEAEKVHTYTLKLTTQEITVSSSISNWTTGKDGSGNAVLD